MGVVELALACALLVACVLLAAALWRLRAARRDRQLLDHLPQTVVAAFDRELRVTLAAGAGLALGERRAEDIVGSFLLGDVPQAEREPLLIHYRAALRGERRSFEYRSAKTGRDYWVRLVPLTDRPGEITGGLSVALDLRGFGSTDPDLGHRADAVTAVTDATRALARSVDSAGARMAVCEGVREVAAAPVAALFEPSADGSALVPKACAGAELDGLSLPLAEELGSTLAFVRSEEVFVGAGASVPEADREFMRRAQVESVLWHPVVRGRAALGVLAIGWRHQVAGVSQSISWMVELLGAEAAVAISRADLLSQLEHLARTDGLTGLPNRRHWEQQLPRELARAERDRLRICVAMLDLDHFKRYNDRRGHLAGDRLLVEATQAWHRALRPYDVLARFGGEEFSLILPGCDLADAVVLVERLRAAMPAGESCSAGIAEWDGAESADALVGRADAALYGAKRAGRDRAVIASPS